MQNERIKGPVKHGRRWRVIHYFRDGTSVTHSFPTEAEAARKGAELRKGLQQEALTVAKALEEYEQYMRRKGNKESSIATTCFRMRGLLDVDSPIVSVDRRMAQRLYDRLVGRDVSVDTQRNALGQAKTFWRWLIKRGYVKQNPWEHVEPVGRRRRGKEQLTHDECRELSGYCLARLEEPGCAAALCGLWLALRASEIAGVKESDVDCDGRVLIVRGTKSERSHRKVALPSVLREAVRTVARAGMSRYQVRDKVRAATKAAIGRAVTPHALRGTHATLAVGAQISPQAVAASLGHASATVTERHYIAPGTLDLVTQQRALQALVPLDSRRVVPSSEGQNGEAKTSTKTSAKGGTRTPTALTTRSLVLSDSRLTLH